jgi:acyl-coenzyme A thioesterase PaaI-like protein
MHVTTEISAKLLKPVFVGEKMYLRGEIMSEKDDVVIVKAEIRNSRKELCTVSEIKLRVLSEELLKKFTGK